MKIMNKRILFLLWPLLLAVYGCNDMEDVERVYEFPEGEETEGLLILSEGLFNMNNSTLARYDFGKQELEADVFRKFNKRGLGDTANDMKVYGSKLYIVVNVSSQIEVLDTESYLSQGRIPMFSEEGVARQPRYIAFHEGKGYVCCFDGTVSRIDTTSLRVEETVRCGRNPDGICIANGKIYVSNSGGLDNPNYDHTVSVIDIASFREIKKIETAPNPYTLHADSEGDVYVVSRGDHFTIPYRFQKIDTTIDEVIQTFGEIRSLNFTIFNDKAYIYNYDYATRTSWVKVFDCLKEQVVEENFILGEYPLHTPYGIDVNPLNGDVYLTDAYSYTIWGDVLCFDRSGKFKFRISGVGLNPNTVLFINKEKENVQMQKR